MRFFLRLLLISVPYMEPATTRCSKLWISTFPASYFTPPLISRREDAVKQLSDEVFSKGNVHLKNVSSISSLPEGLHSFPEVCFIGKPNVGKSSIISCLLHNRRLGRSGATRGTTRLLQFFNVGDAMLLVDTPGYGGWKGRQLSQNLAERATAFAALFRYLALRRQGPLKRVYWVMEAVRPIQPRDEELLVFLQREKINFSIILSKIDKFKGDSRALRQQVGTFWDFLGSDQVPILGVRANPKFPEMCFNITALQHDITYYCTQELTRLDDLTYKGLKGLSYAPPTLEDISAVEQRYPVESFILPQDDNLSLKRFVSLHEEAKFIWLTTSPKAALLSAKEKVANHLLPCGGKEDAENVCDASFSLPLLLEKNLKVADQLVPTAEMVGASPLSQQVKQSRRFSVRASLRAAIRPYPVEELCLEKESASPHDVCDTTVMAEIVNDLDSSLSRNTDSVISVAVPLLPPLLPRLDDEVHTVRAINGVRIPMSMVTSSVREASACNEGSLQNFARHSGPWDYDALMKEMAGQQIFLEDGKDAGLFDGDTSLLQRPLKKSARRKRLEHIMKKYILRVRKRRSLYMQAEGYMCPWLGGAGQPLRASVMGLARGQSSVARSGSLMMGLKRTGFGGQSYSANTMKHRGRATKKTGFWAA